MSSSAPRAARPPSGILKLLLLGAGHAHLQVLARLAQDRPAHLDVTVLTPYPYLNYSAMAPGVVAGHYQSAECQIRLSPWLQRSGARVVQGRAQHIDTAQRLVHYNVRPQDPTPAPLSYDLLSLDLGGGYNPDWLDQHLPGAREHALLLRPLERFVRLWDDVLTLAQRKPLSLAVVGAGAAGCETTLALAHRLRATPHPHRLSLVAGPAGVLPQAPLGVQQRVLRQLKRQGVTVLPQACVGVAAGEVLLDGGGRLQCDVPLLAVGGQAPQWLAATDLACSDSGRVRVDAQQRSISHPEVFAAGDVCQREDCTTAPNGVQAVRAGLALAHNLVAAATGAPLRTHRPPRHSLSLIGCGVGHAIAHWGPLHAEGAWVWHWKTRIDRAWVARWQLPTDAPPSRYEPSRF
jgi:NADH dehydrogenase FAD-containing subunit